MMVLIISIIHYILGTIGETRELSKDSMTTLRRKDTHMWNKLENSTVK